MPRTEPLAPTPETNGSYLPQSDGDPANAPRDREVNARAHLLQEALRGFAHGGALPRYFEVDAGGSSTSFTVRVAATPTLLVKRTGAASGSIRQHAAGAELTAVVAVSDGALTQVEGPLAALAFNTCYAVHALSNGTSGITLTIAPMGSAAPALWPFRTGTREQRYCGCFWTDGAGAPIQVRASNGRYTYARWYDGTQNIVYGPAGGAGTSLVTLPRLPPTARNVRLYVAAVTGTPGISDPTDSSVSLPLVAGRTIELVANASQQVRLHAAAPGDGATLILTGFDEG